MHPQLLFRTRPSRCAGGKHAAAEVLVLVLSYEPCDKFPATQHL